MALRVYTALLDSKNPMQKSEFIQNISGLNDYEWSKARDTLSDKGLMRYNSSTKKWRAFLPNVS